MTATATAAGVSPFAIPPMTTAHERLTALTADLNLRHSAARWRAHAEVYPAAAHDAAQAAELAGAGDAMLAMRVVIVLDEFRAKLSAGDEAAVYPEWVLSLLQQDPTT